MLILSVRVMRVLGAHTLIASNAVGGVNPAYQPGHFMLIRDHINLPSLTRLNPLIEPNDEHLGPRFPPLTKTYDTKLRTLARTVTATQPEITLHKGIYAIINRPNYETTTKLHFLH